MAILSRNFASILRRFSPDSEEGQCYVIPSNDIFRDHESTPESIKLHIHNFQDDDGKAMLEIRSTFIDSLGIIDIVSFIVSTGRNFSNCSLIDYTQRWISKEPCGDFRIRVGTTTNDSYPSVSQYVETKDMIDCLEQVLNSLNKSQTKDLER